MKVWQFRLSMEKPGASSIFWTVDVLRLTIKTRILHCCGQIFDLAIPNLEIREIYTEQIMELFKENIKKNGDAVNAFCDALQNGDVEKAEKGFSDYLRKTISIRDTFVKKSMKENFYHGILLGLLGYKDTWIISSNEEPGDGYSDILVRSDDEELGIVIEVKYADAG